MGDLCVRRYFDAVGAVVNDGALEGASLRGEAAEP